MSAAAPVETTASGLPSLRSLTSMATAATRAPGVPRWRECHTSSAVSMALADSVLKSNVATDALTRSGNSLFHLDATRMAQQQLVNLTFSLQMSLMSFFAVWEGEPSK